jgi:hypothetical protein
MSHLFFLMTEKKEELYGSFELNLGGAEVRVDTRKAF